MITIGVAKMLENIEFKELSNEDIHTNLLDDFNRYQKVTKCWVFVDTIWTLKNVEYVVDWDKEKKMLIINEIFSKIIKYNNGNIFGAFIENKLIGFSVLMNQKFGSKNQYIQLRFMHVTLDYRGKGIGKKLFMQCVDKAKEIGIEKIYISANDSVETISFYMNLGCVDAVEINKKIADEEPYDRQLEYRLL